MTLRDWTPFPAELLSPLGWPHPSTVISTAHALYPRVKTLTAVRGGHLYPTVCAVPLRLRLENGPYDRYRSTTVHLRIAATEPGPYLRLLPYFTDFLHAGPDLHVGPAPVDLFLALDGNMAIPALPPIYVGQLKNVPGQVPSTYWSLRPEVHLWLLARLTAYTRWLLGAPGAGTAAAYWRKSSPVALHAFLRAEEGAL